MAADVAPRIDSGALREFLDLIRDGEGHITAGIAAGLSPRQVREMEADPEYGELIGVARTQRIEGYEKRLHDLAMDGNFPALQLELFCQASDRGWRPPQQRVAHEVNNHITIERVMSTKAAVLELIAEHGPGILAIGGPLDAIEAGVSDES
jgi:hypothetical protein